MYALTKPICRAGRCTISPKDEATDRQAKADYEIAIAADPNFALAHAALSRSLSSIAAAYAEAGELKAIYSTGNR